MKKVFTSIVVVLILTMLAACGGNATATQNQASDTQSSADNNGTQVDSSSTSSGQASEGLILAAGTLKLEGTDLAVTKDQATQLLPLWKAVRSFASSDTITESEIDAVYQQIEQELTSDQMQAINEMNITQDSMQSILSDLGYNQMPNASGTDTGTSTGGFPDDGSFPQGGPDAGGGFPGGVAPSGGGAGGGGFPSGGAGGGGFAGGGAGGGNFTGANASAQGTENPQMATQVAEMRARTASIPMMLLSPIINVLSERAGVATPTPEVPPAMEQSTPTPEG